jgi:capsular polysaccharide biosynthesis protein
MTVQSADPAGVIYDHAGRNTSSQFVSNLNVQEGGQPRVIDVAVNKNRPAVQAEVLSVVTEVMKRTNQQLKVR